MASSHTDIQLNLALHSPALTGIPPAVGGYCKAAAQLG